MSEMDPTKLTAKQRALLERRLIDRRVAAARADVIPRRSGGGPVSVSFAQERLWFVEQITPGNAAYHIADAFLIDGRVDVALLARSLTALVQRHESLRTTFALDAGRPFRLLDHAKAACGPSHGFEPGPAERALG